MGDRMRFWIMLGLLGCQVSQEQAEPLTVGQDFVADAHPDATLPPPTVVTLEGPSFVTVGASFDLGVPDAMDGERVFFAIGAEEGEGPCKRAIGSYCLDLVEPVSLEAVGETDDLGRAVASLTAPRYAGSSACFQAVIQRGPSGIYSALSNVVCIEFCAADDADGDGVCDAFDVCPDGDDAADLDEDGVCDALDECWGGPDDADEDGDGFCDLIDVCPGGADDADADGDGVCDALDACAGFDDAIDEDGSGVPDGCDGSDLENEVIWEDYRYASIDDVRVDAGYGEDGTCQTDPYPVPDGWEIAEYMDGIEDFINSHGWSTHCMILADGCSYGTFNYGLGGCGCDVMETDGTNWWATSCSRRMFIRRPL
jgi:hypothetical protein